jgi:DNA-binding NtrC family response regulator
MTGLVINCYYRIIPIYNSGTFIACKFIEIQLSLVFELQVYTMKKVLIVDDEPMIRELLEEMLEREGMDVRSASNGEEALKELRTSFYDMCFLDIILPGINGVETMGKIREVSPGTKIALMTGYSHGSNVARGKKNADYFLTKPFDPSQIKRVIKKLL